MIKVIVAGGRNFDDYTLLCSTLNRLFRNRRIGEITILCGKASGADSLGDKYARSRGIAVDYYPAEWDNLDAVPCVVKRTKKGKPYNCLAGKNRNKQMAEDGTHLVAFWDGFSTGTEHMIEVATNLGLIVKVINY